MSSNARQLAANLPREGGLSNRNMVINGACTVAQRASSVTGVTASGYYTTDRFSHGISNLGTWTIDNSTDAPSGFSNSHKVTCTTAKVSPDAANYHIIQYRIEGQDLQRLGYGTSSAKPMTFSFWVKSNKTGGASIDMYQPDNSNRLWGDTYTINSADTWEYKTFTIPADTSGLINNNNGIGLTITIWLNAGSTYTGGAYQTTWAAINQANRNVNNLGVGGAVNDYFAFTGVQLEVGTATPFEHRPYSDQLQACQRYYYKVANSSSAYYGTRYSDTNVMMIQSLPTVMRADPTVGYTSIGGSGTFAGDYSRADRITIYITDTNGAASIYGAYADAEL